MDVPPETLVWVFACYCVPVLLCSCGDDGSFVASGLGAAGAGFSSCHCFPAFPSVCTRASYHSQVLHDIKLLIDLML